MAAAAPGSHCYFYEDEVYRVNARGQVGFGLVLDNCEPSSSDSDNEPPLQRGDLRVVWHPSGKERVVSDKAVGLADRALLPGDVVRRMIKGKDTQRGYCRDIIVTGAVQVVGTNLVLPAVPSERLHPLAEFTADLAVCLDSWVGTSKIVHSKLRLISSDGSRLEFPDVNLCLLEDCLQRRRCGGRGGIEHQAANEFYPGQTVVGPLGALDHAAWLHVTKEMEAARKHKMREHKFTVECVETESVGVHWQCRALGEQAGGGPPQQPRFLVEGEDLKRLRLLNLFEPCTVQVGAKNFLTLTTEDTFCTKAQWKKTQNKIYRALRKQARPPRSNKSKETKEPKEIIKEASVQTLDANITSNHNFRTPSKSKKRLSAFNRDGKIFCYHNIQTQTSIDNKCGSTKDVEIASKDDSNQQHKMDVDIVIMGDKTTKIGGNPSNVNVKVSCLDANVCNPNEHTNVNTALASILPQRSDDGSHLDVPDKACNGKCTSSDRSCSPDCVDTSEKQKKLRKSRVSSANNSRSNSPAVFNGDHKTTEVRNDINDSDSWGNTSSDEATDTDSCGTWSSQCSSSTNNSMASGRGKKSPHLVTKFLKGKRLKKTARRNSNVPQPKPEDRVVVETLCTKSKANVVWQDGTIEFGIPSTELYPIHHLDGQECFPGDFVISGATSESSSSHRDYGVVQKVDHYGRTAIVKWFRTYTSCQEPIPQFVTESEVSVYDLKDHPDFQYRPGTVVIRVANFIGTEASCTAGQVMDNFPSGHVKVWWVDGHTSMCWPQDLYKVGEYDSDEGDIWADEESSSDDSWETQSSMGDSSGESHKGKKSIDKDDDNGDECILLPDVDTDASAAALLNSSKGELPKVPRGLEPRAAAHIEKGLNAMARMEEILSQNPSLQTHEIMRKLLTLYKDCRFLDRLMGTSFFHEDHFQGLLERVRERGGSRESGSGNAGVRRVQNQVLRLFSRDDSDGPEPFIPMSMIEKDVSEEDANIPLDLSNTLISETNQKTAINTSLPQVEINNLNAKESTETSKPADVKSNCNLDDNDDIKMPTIVSTDGNSNLKESLTDACTTTPSKDVSSKYGALSPPNDNSVSKFGTLSPISDGSLSKYGTPVGSIGDLANQNDRSPNCTMDKNKNEDSGIDSQSLSISQSANNASINCESSVAGSKTLSKDSSKKSEVLSKTSSATSSSDSQLSNRNVCQKLCSLITKQLMKAFAEMNRRRNSLLVQFLNRLMKEKVTSGAPLPYRFSVQFDTMVITMEDESNENNTDGNTSTDIKIDEVKNVIETDENAHNIENTKETPVENTLNTTSEFGEGFQVLESAPTSHHFRLSLLQPSEPRAFHQAVAREIKLLKSDLPPGVWVRGYEDRMDLLSIMIAGPAKTPYEDGLFLFDVQLGGEYPRAPPLCHYLSYCSDRLNPNLYEDGKVCVSLLGTWSGRGVEVWRRDSSLLQVIVSLQGLILCAEPYFNEAGYDKQKGSQQGSENSRMYNEMVLLKLVQSLTKMVLHPPDIFKAEIFAFQSRHASGLCDRLVHWMIMSEEHNSHHPGSPSTTESVISDSSKFDMQPPEYPLIPASRGFCLTLRSSLDSYRNALTKAGISFEKNL